ncbi:MAG: GAF domain-containing sensor histidine kinase [Nitrospira sp.]|nr:GAF domain-containing sensor histidine kinase [Nitrospira sp.]
MTELLSKDHRILEKGLMEYRPFGVDELGEKIRDVSGVTVRANVEYLEDVIGRLQGSHAGSRAVEELACLLNARIRDPAYHVSPAFLKNPWNSYSYEFVCFLGELCKTLTGDPLFAFHVGQEKFIPPIIQALAQPFSVSQIYKMFPHFGEKFAKGSIHFEVVTVTTHSAILRMKFTEKVYQQFGPYRAACADLICQSSKAGLSAVPERVQHLSAASVKDLTCIADGAEYCEWEFSWEPRSRRRLPWQAAGLLAGAAAFAYLRVQHPQVTLVEAFLVALFPATTLWLAHAWRNLRKEAQARTELIQDQLHVVESRHEELREAHLDREQSTVELRQKIAQLTTLHNAGLIFSSTLDRETVLEHVLKAITHDLHYDCAIIASYDPVRQVQHDARIFGVPDDLEAHVRSIEVPVTDPNGVEGAVFWEGRPTLAKDIRKIWDRLHPLQQHVVSVLKAKSMICVPLKVKDRVIGCLTVYRITEHCVTQGDLDLMVTMANHVAIALDNAAAYREIEELNVGLEAKVHERTAALERSNARLKELDRQKSAFVSIVSHELRTPMMSLKGYVENMLDGLAGRVTEKQRCYLDRAKHNVERLTRMINQLLDLSRIEAGRIELQTGPVSIPELVAEVQESQLALAHEKLISVDAQHPNSLPVLMGDRDKLHQILTNLLHNAIKFTPKGGKIRIESTVLSDGYLQLCVADTGCGVPVYEIDRVFERFYRSDSAPRDARGSGLGLAITKTMVELHGGRIWVESTPGQGSQFFVTLPTEQHPL